MNFTLQEYKEMPEIVLPWKGKDTGFTLTDVMARCSCGLPLVSLRGNIFEMSGVIEMRMGGICPRCRFIVPCRCRVYSKTGIFAQEKNGKWEESKMITFKQKWFRETMKTLLPAWGGLSVVIVFALVCLKLTMWTYIGWGVVAICMLVLSILAGLHLARRK